MRDGGGDCGSTGDCNVAGGHPASDCPPFCTSDGVAHGPTTGGTDSSTEGSDSSSNDDGGGGGGHPWDVVTSVVGKAGHALGKTTTVVRTYAEAILTNQDVWIGGGETVASLILIVAGSAGDEAGIAACATVVGCYAGGPLILASTAGIGYGANVAGGAAKTLGDGLNTALNEAQDSAGGSESSPDWIPDGATSKIPSSFGEGKPTQKGEGWRWNDGKGNGIRIILRSISKLTTLS